MNLTLIGPPGAGKTAQSVRLSRTHGLYRISIGTLIRQKTDDPLLNKHSAEGTLVPDALVVRLLETELRQREAYAGVVIDGFPRTGQQAHELDQLLGRSLDLVVRIGCDPDELIWRILRRRRCLTCKRQVFLDAPSKANGRCEVCGETLFRRTEDTEPIARQRLAVYTQQASSILEHYELQGKLLSVDCALRQDDLFEVLNRQILAKLER